MSLSKDEQNRKANSGMYKRCACVGGGSGLLSCTCMVVTMVLFAVIPGLALFVFGVVGPFEIFFLYLGCSVMAGISAFDLKRNKALSVQGIKRLKGPISVSVAIFVIIVVTLFYVAGPSFMAQLQHFQQH